MVDQSRAPLTAQEILLLQDAVKQNGKIRVLADGGFSYTTLWRAMAGMDLNRGTRLMIRNYLGHGEMKESA